MVQFLSINFFSWISSIFVGFFKSSRFFVLLCIYALCCGRTRPCHGFLLFKPGYKTHRTISLESDAVGCSGDMKDDLRLVCVTRSGVRVGFARGRHFTSNRRKTPQTKYIFDVCLTAHP